MSRQFYCELCGGLFNRPAKGNRKMWCDDCKPQAEKLYQAEYYKRRKGEIDQLRAAIAAKDAEIERIKKNHGCAREQGATQYCREALDAHKEADAMRADAALGAAVRGMPEGAMLWHSEDTWYLHPQDTPAAPMGQGDTPEAAMIAARLTKGEGE